MPWHDSEELEALVAREPPIFPEVAEEALWLEQPRKHLEDQGAFLDLERTELEQRLAALQQRDAFLDALSTYLDCEKRRLALTRRSSA